MGSPEKKRRTGRTARFPGKLHDMMKFAEATGLESIVGWALDGHGIKIHHPEMLVEQILPHFFAQTKYRSFQRQLNMWHFHRIADGPNKGVFVHPYFVKHNPELSGLMSRDIELKPEMELTTYSVLPDIECSSQAMILSNEPLPWKPVMDFPTRLVLPDPSSNPKALALSKEPDASDPTLPAMTESTCCAKALALFD